MLPDWPEDDKLSNFTFYQNQCEEVPIHAFRDKEDETSMPTRTLAMDGQESLVVTSDKIHLHWFPKEYSVD